MEHIVLIYMVLAIFTGFGRSCFLEITTGAYCFTILFQKELEIDKNRNHLMGMSVLSLLNQLGWLIFYTKPMGIDKDRIDEGATSGTAGFTVFMSFILFIWTIVTVLSIALMRS